MSELNRSRGKKTKERRGKQKKKEGKDREWFRCTRSLLGRRRRNESVETSPPPITSFAAGSKGSVSIQRKKLQREISVVLKRIAQEKEEKKQRFEARARLLHVQ